MFSDFVCVFSVLHLMGQMMTVALLCVKVKDAVAKMQKIYVMRSRFFFHLRRQMSSLYDLFYFSVRVGVFLLGSNCLTHVCLF
jgi:hypothetical protein